MIDALKARDEQRAGDVVRADIDDAYKVLLDPVSPPRVFNIRQE
ncbi:hypothetical protein [Nordella sp. HKS 07]|nr:hypothetical protein [Nordella sp. HKS 07]